MQKGEEKNFLKTEYQYIMMRATFAFLPEIKTKTKHCYLRLKKYCNNQKRRPKASFLILSLFWKLKVKFIHKPCIFNGEGFSVKIGEMFGILFKTESKLI